MFDFTKRIYISLYCGAAIPFVYFLLMMVLDSILGDHLAGASRWLMFPLTWLGAAFESIYHPTIRSVGDVFGAAMDVILVTIVGNFIFYSGLTFLLLSVRTAFKRHRGLLV